MNIARLVLLLITVVPIGCGQHQERNDSVLPNSHESLAPFAEAIGQFDRARAGFPALPTNGTVKVEAIDRENWHREYPPPRYDVMLHFVDDTSGFRYSYCTVALKKTAAGLTWMGEQHAFHGPLEYENDGAMQHEAVTIAVASEQIAHVETGINGVVLRYTGPVSRDLARSDVDPILSKWGYLPPPGNAQQSTRSNSP